MNRVSEDFYGHTDVLEMGQSSDPFVFQGRSCFQDWLFFFLEREKFNGPVIYRLHQNLSPFFLSALNVYVRQRVKENVYGSRKLIFIS